MASSFNVKDEVFTRLNKFGLIEFRKMMGEFLLYFNGKLIGGIYDDVLLIKQTKTNYLHIENACFLIPYPSAKPMLKLELNLNDDEIFNVLNTTFNELY